MGVQIESNRSGNIIITETNEDDGSVIGHTALNQHEWHQRKRELLAKAPNAADLLTMAAAFSFLLESH